MSTPFRQGQTLDHLIARLKYLREYVGGDVPVVVPIYHDGIECDEYNEAIAEIQNIGPLEIDDDGYEIRKDKGEGNMKQVVVIL